MRRRRSAPSAVPGRSDTGASVTQRVEEELRERFPDARIVRMDMDTTSRKGSHQDIFHRVLNREADILLGTQMVAKGFDFPNVTLVGRHLGRQPPSTCPTSGPASGPFNC